MLALLSVTDAYTLTVLAVYGILALSLGLIWGFGGILCFGQAAFYGLGAYSFAIYGINVGEAWSALFIAMLVPAVFAAVFGTMLFYGRLGDVYLAVVTLVMTLILFKFMNSTAGEAYVIGEARLGGFNGIPGYPTLYFPGKPGQYLSDLELYFFTFSCLLSVYLLCRWLLARPFGRIVIGIRENETRAELLGYDIRLYKTAIFTIGGTIAGLAGALYANWSEIVTPNLFSLGQSAENIVWVIFGGAGTLIGPIIGAAVLGFLKFLLGQQGFIDNTFVMGVLLVFAVLWFPRGVVPGFHQSYLKLTGSRRKHRSRTRRRQTKAGRKRENG